MGTVGAVDNHGALDARERRQRKMANPENKVGSFIHRYTLADPLNHSFFKVKAEGLFRQEFDTHIII